MKLSAESSGLAKLCSVFTLATASESRGWDGPVVNADTADRVEKISASELASQVTRWMGVTPSSPSRMLTFATAFPTALMMSPRLRSSVRG